jgi:phosphatidate cytidylyltransferase
MSNTKLRLISTLVMIIGVILLCIAGPKYCLGFIGIVGVLVIDEIMVNFVEVKRKNQNYFLAQLSYVVGFSYVNFMAPSYSLYKVFMNAGVVLNIIGLAYLFLFNKKNSKLFTFFSNYSFLSGVLVLIPFTSMAYFFSLDKWFYILWALLLLNFSMDSGAWFFGKNFGKHKLWAKVSPNKTVEGLIGGILTSVVVTSIYWYFCMGNMKALFMVFFALLAGSSQLGDLIQSKLKRQFDIKDSSNLIPGHGGVYDRIDSLIFVAPMFALLLEIMYPFAI